MIFPTSCRSTKREARSHRMTAAVEKVRAAEVAAMQGRTASVLLETPLSNTLFTGYTKQYLPVLVMRRGIRPATLWRLCWVHGTASAAVPSFFNILDSSWQASACLFS